MVTCILEATGKSLEEPLSTPQSVPDALMARTIQGLAVGRRVSSDESEPRLLGCGENPGLKVALTSSSSERESDKLGTSKKLSLLI